jgi:hypothetical protein
LLIIHQSPSTHSTTLPPCLKPSKVERGASNQPILLWVSRHPLHVQ